MSAADQTLSLVRRQLVRLRARMDRALVNIDRGTEQGRVAWTAVDEAKVILQGLGVAVGPLTEEDVRAEGEQKTKG